MSVYSSVGRVSAPGINGGRKDLMSILNTARVHQASRSLIRVSRKAHVHQMLGIIIIVAHASEIVRVVSHISVWHLTIAFAVFTLWMLSQEDAASELA
jgi:hypothetical protein